MSKGKTTYGYWTEQDKKLLIDIWEECTLSEIANIFGKTPNAIDHVARKLKLPPHRELVTGKKYRRWTERKIIKFKKIKLVGKMTYKVITLDNLMKVLEKHQDIWDATKVDFYALGSEPLWLQEKRRRDAKMIYGNNNEAWTVMQEQQLYSMWRKKVPQKEIAETLGKTQRAVRHRIQKLRKEWIKREQLA